MKPFRRITPEARALCLAAAKSGRLHAVKNSNRLRPGGFFHPDEMRVADSFAEACVVDTTTDGLLDRAASNLPPEIFTVLVLSLGARLGFEAVEKAMGIPVRSAKLLAAIGLGHLIWMGVLSV